jgi:hypothetical protein
LLIHDQFLEKRGAISSNIFARALTAALRVETETSATAVQPPDPSMGENVYRP